MPKKVLIAEDYADVRSITKFMVETCGYEVIEAQDGYEAYEEAKVHFPDIILMDIAMPLMNGITSTAHLRSLERFEKTPIVAITAYGKDYPAKAADYGFDEILHKPVQLDGLRKVLDRYLGSASNQVKQNQ
jgi:CheY-like chemotaxis protein